MIFRRRRVRVEIEQSTLTLRLAPRLVPTSPTETAESPAASSLPQPNTDSVSRPETEPNSTPEGIRHDL
jgi:hypothetical protein